jgi:hypothetical protein
MVAITATAGETRAALDAIGHGLRAAALVTDEEKEADAAVR